MSLSNSAIGYHAISGPAVAAGVDNLRSVARGAVDARRPLYFTQTFQLFPCWPHFDVQRLVSTMTLLDTFQQGRKIFRPYSALRRTGLYQCRGWSVRPRPTMARLHLAERGILAGAVCHSLHTDRRWLVGGFVTDSGDQDGAAVTDGLRNPRRCALARRVAGTAASNLPPLQTPVLL